MASRIAIFAVGISSLLLLVSCTNAHKVVRFGYSGSIGPQNWGNLSPDYALCSEGKHQSPINIAKDDAQLDPKLQSLDRDYIPTNATLIDNGFNIMVKYDDGVGSVSIDGKNYTLKQMHWHSPSEHTIDGERFPAELHLVHVSEDGNITVVAILYEYGDPDPFLSKLKEKMEELANEVCSGDEEAHIPIELVDTKAMRRNTRKYYRYVGSLTTPPCTENVVWNILGKVRNISKEQVQALMAPLEKEYHNNSRPTQPINGRKVCLYSEGDLQDTETN